MELSENTLTQYDYGRTVLLGVNTHETFHFDTFEEFDVWRAEQNFIEVLSRECWHGEPLEEDTEIGVLLTVIRGELLWVGNTWTR